MVIQNSGFYSTYIFIITLPQILVFSPLAGMSMRHSGPPLPRDLRHCGTQSTVGTGCVLAFPFFALLACVSGPLIFYIFPLTLPSLPPYNFSRQEMAVCLLIRPFARRCCPVWRGLSFIYTPSGTPRRFLLPQPLVSVR